MNKVISSQICVGNTGKPYLECNIQDGSIWKCDIDGENWRVVKPSDEFLTTKFNEANGQ